MFESRLRASVFRRCFNVVVSCLRRASGRKLLIDKLVLCATVNNLSFVTSCYLIRQNMLLKSANCLITVLLQCGAWGSTVVKALCY